MRLTRSLFNRAMIEFEEKVFHSLRNVRDPTAGGKSIRSLGYLKGLDVKKNQLTLSLPSPFHPLRAAILSEIKSALPPSVEVVESYGKASSSTGNAAENDDTKNLTGPGLDRTQAIVAVYSCKGGVGKSTVSVNLAYALAKIKNLRIGLLDCDIYGPSLPTLIDPQDITVRRSEIGKMVKPIDHHGVKVLSLGYVSPKSGIPGAGAAISPTTSVEPAVIRGPMASRVVTQLIKGTDWGDLDILLLDMPPGTGDVQLTMCQEVVMDGAVAVTTPGSLSKVDVLKGIEMFQSLNIPTLAAVENMSYFVNPTTKEEHKIFGIQSEYSDLSLSSPDDLVRIPLSEALSSANDSSLPIMLSPPSASTEASAYTSLADVLVKKLFERDTMMDVPLDTFSSSSSDPLLIDGKPVDLDAISLKFDKARGLLLRIFSENGATERVINPAVLLDTNPKTGESLGGKSGNVRPVVRSIERKGSYGYAITWQNGATFIYSMQVVVDLSEE